MRRSLIVALGLAIGVLPAYADQPPAGSSTGPAAPELTLVEIVDRVRAQAATQLGRRKADIETTRPLFAQGLDELDLVELVMALEESFKVPIPDAELAPGGDKDWFRKLTVQKLADVIAAQLHVTK